jgi:hypothetical protein
VSKQRDHEEHRQEIEERIEDLTKELSELINASGAKGREELRDYAISLLQGETETSSVEDTPPPTRGSSSFNPFALAIPFLLVGAFLLLLFPPIGLFLILGAIVMMVWGGLLAFFAKKR